jgi:hypothetical protein
MRRIGLLCLVAVVSALALGCSAKPQAKVPPQPESVQTAVGRLLGPGAIISTVDTRTISGRPATTFVGVKVETTPTASAIVGLLSVVAGQYPDQGRQVVLITALPENSPGNREVVYLRWNPTGITIPTDGGTDALPPQSLSLDVGHGSDVILLSQRNIRLASRVTTEQIETAARGEGVLLKRFQEKTGLK